MLGSSKPKELNGELAFLAYSEIIIIITLLYIIIFWSLKDYLMKKST